MVATHLAKGHDVRAVAGSPELAGLPDEEILTGLPRRAERW